MTQKSDIPETLTVLYDGDCPLCQREIRHVKGLSDRNGHCGLAFIDVSSDGGCAPDEKAALLARFHVQKADGSRLSGAEAFVAMWSRLPGWRVLAWIARRPGMLPVFEMAYRFFLKIRPRLQAVARRLDHSARQDKP